MFFFSSAKHIAMQIGQDSGTVGENITGWGGINMLNEKGEDKFHPLMHFKFYDRSHCIRLSSHQSLDFPTLNFSVFNSFALEKGAADTI